MQKAHHEQSRANEQHDRQGKLRSDESVAEPLAAMPGEATSSTGLNRTGDTPASRTQRREHPRNKGRKKRNAHGERQNRSVQPKCIRKTEAAQTSVIGRLNGAAQAERQQQAEEDASGAQRQRLGKELPDHTSAAGAESRPHRNFLAAGRGTREQQARDICARNEEHETDGPEEQQKQCPDFADKVLVTRHCGEDHPGIALREPLLETPSGSMQLGASRIDADAGRQARNHAHILVAVPAYGTIRREIAAISQRYP